MREGHKSRHHGFNAVFNALVFHFLLQDIP